MSASVQTINCLDAQSDVCVWLCVCLCTCVGDMTVGSAVVPSNTDTTETPRTDQGGQAGRGPQNTGAIAMHTHGREHMEERFRP